MQSTRSIDAVGGLAILAVAALALTFASPAASQDVRLYRGTLQIGFGDPMNQTLPPGSNPPADVANNGVPACANANPFLPATIATLPVTGWVEQGTGAVPRSLMFDGYAPFNLTNQTGGGQKPVVDSTCIVQFPPWLAANALRSRVQFGSQVWPGNHLNAANTAFTTGTSGGGTLAANGGVAAATTFNQPFYGAAGGQIQIVPGPNRFGGGVPVNGRGDVQLGVNAALTNGQGQPLSTFGIVPYATGFLPTGPAAYGTDASGTGIPVGVPINNPYTWVARTKGPTGTAGTIPLTARLGWSQGVTQTAMIPDFGTFNVTTMGDFGGIFQKWTTGMVQHTDMSGDYTTQRTATGHDWTEMEFAANGTSAGPFGTTRKLQLVTPWSASIKKRGDNPFFAMDLEDLPDFGFGGLAILTLDISPVPEPASISLLAFGVGGLIGLGALGRRRR